MSTSGSPPRGGARRGKPARRLPPLNFTAPAIGAVVALIAWGVLVWVAIGFGRSARGGDSGAWWWLALAATGAVVCLLGSLTLVTLSLRRIGILAPRESASR